MVKYKCMVIDHDDTVVMSSRKIHYPSFLHTLAELRPEVRMGFDEFMEICFEKGFNSLCRDILHFSDREMRRQDEIWINDMQTGIPEFYPGMPELIEDYRKAGGIVCVVSHSNESVIRRDYNNAGIKDPELVFGWELGEEKRKPSAYPIERITEYYGLKMSDIIVVDDMKSGKEMAELCGTEFACAGWSHEVEVIRKTMRKICTNYLATVNELKDFIVDRK